MVFEMHYHTDKCDVLMGCVYVMLNIIHNQFELLHNKFKDYNNIH